MVPAINKCGIVAKSAKKAFPPMSLPRASSRLALDETNFSFLNNSLKKTASWVLLGISIPITFLPGIIATLADTALIFLAISSDKPIIFEAFVPGAGCNSYIVTTGPGLTFIISPSILKSDKISLSLIALLSISSFETNELAETLGVDKISIIGGT